MKTTAIIKAKNYDFTELINIAISEKKLGSKFLKNKRVNMTIEVDGETWQAYEASITYRDIFLFCDKGCATFLVDSYGDRHTVELFDWEKE